MKILVVCQYYYPEPFRVTDICEELVKRGHEVMVLTGEPNYPEGEFYKGYEKHEITDEIISGVRVHRCRIIPRKTGTLYRFLNYYSFVLSSLQYVYSGRCLSVDNTPFDIVFVNQLSPVMMAYPGLAYKRKYGSPVILYCLDLWPESLLAGGIKKDSIIYNVFRIVSKRIYENVNQICTSSKMFKLYFDKQFGIPEDTIKYLPQYAESIFNTTVKEASESNIFNFTFAGNIGSMQSVDTILKAAELLRNEPVHFNIIGSGSELNRLKEYASNSHLTNVTFYGRQPLEKMPSYYSAADAMIITLKSDPIISLTLPGKVQSYMAAGKPIIGSVDGEAKTIIDEAKCGYCCEAENPYELSRIILEFINNIERDNFGMNSFNYYKSHFSKDAFFDCFDSILSKEQI